MINRESDESASQKLPFASGKVTLSNLDHSLTQAHRPVSLTAKFKGALTYFRVRRAAGSID